MKKFGDFICEKRKLVIIISIFLLFLSFVGIKLTKINYDILVYLPQDNETIIGQNILTNDFHMGAYSIATIENMSNKEIIELQEKIKNVKGVNKVVSLYNLIGTTIPVEMLPTEITNKVHKNNTDLLFITFDDSTSAELTINAVSEIREVTEGQIKQGGMSSMVLDTMNLSEQEIAIYILIAVILCIFVLEISLDSYVVPIILLLNIGFTILLNLGTNVFLGQISYITKALVAVLQLGVTTDFSIFLYHSYENKKDKFKTKKEAMSNAIKDTFSSVTGSSLTTIAGFLVLCFMQLTLGKDLGIVMAKGVLLGVITVLTLFPSLLLIFDNLIEKTRHKILLPNFNKLNTIIVKYNKLIFAIFVILLVPFYLAYSKVDVYYKIDKSLPSTLESIKTNEILKNDYDIVSPEIILINKNIKNNQINKMVDEINKVEGIDFVLSYSEIKKYGITENVLNEEIVNIFENDKYQAILLNSLYDVATDELNKQVKIINKIVKKYDKDAIVAGEGPLMKDLIEISDTDFKNVNTSSIICIFVILFIVLKSISLPFLLIITIEAAIFMNMGISYFGGVVLPFVAPIVLGTIQLGATIDYAILMTNTYLEKRNKIKDKKKAMIETLNYTGSSILVSGMCFFAATFGVGLYSDLEMVGSLCTLISRGAIISMATVILVLPSILIIFDKFIIKTTYRKVNKMKKKIKTALLLLICLIPFNAKAIVKDETVYTKLNYDGSVNKTIVNEKILNPDNLDILEDYSELKNIINVNNNDNYKKENNKLLWNVKGKDLLYQGEINKKLPISLNIKYELNGKEKQIEKIIGKKGHVKITLKYVNNELHNTVSGDLYTPFIVTMGTIINSENNSNIKVTNGKVITNGQNSVVVALALPGMYENMNMEAFKNSNQIIIEYDTTKFELSSMYSIVTSKIIETQDLNIFNKMNFIYSSVNELQTNMNKIESGSKELKNGTNLLINKLNESIIELKNNNGDALTEEQISSIKNSTWENVKTNMDPNDPNVIEYNKNAVISIMTSYLGGLDKLQYFVVCTDTTGTYSSSQKLGACTALTSSTGKSLDEIGTFYSTVSSSITEAASKTSLYVAENVSKSVAQTLSKEVSNQTKSVILNTIIDSLNTLYSNIELLNNGVIELNNGITKFNSEGINKISSLTNNISNTSAKIESLVKLSNDYNTFAGSIDNTGNTKFMLVVDGKKVEKIKIKEKKEIKKENLWDKITNLFN